MSSVRHGCGSIWKPSLATFFLFREILGFTSFPLGSAFAARRRLGGFLTCGSSLASIQDVQFDTKASYFRTDAIFYQGLVGALAVFEKYPVRTSTKSLTLFLKYVLSSDVTQQQLKSTDQRHKALDKYSACSKRAHKCHRWGACSSKQFRRRPWDSRQSTVPLDVTPWTSELGTLSGAGTQQGRSPLRLLSSEQHPAANKAWNGPEYVWHKNYFEQEAFELLKSLICLKVEPSQRIQKNSLCHKFPSPGPVRKGELLSPESIWHHTYTGIVTKLSYVPSIPLRVHLSFLKGFYFPTNPLSPFPSPLKIVYRSHI